MPTAYLSVTMDDGRPPSCRAPATPTRGVDSAGEGRLRHVIELCSAVEIQGSACRTKILDLVHLHIRLDPITAAHRIDKISVFGFLAG
jgi:hypothetical protein